MHECVRACVRAYVRPCVRVGVCVRAGAWWEGTLLGFGR